MGAPPQRDDGVAGWEGQQIACSPGRGPARTGPSVGREPLAHGGSTKEEVERR